MVADGSAWEMAGLIMAEWTQERAVLHARVACLVVLCTRSEQQKLRLEREHTPGDRKANCLDELECAPFREDAIALDTRSSRHNEVTHWRRGPLEAEDAPALLAATMAHMREPCLLQQIDKLELAVGALDCGKAVVEREAYLLYLATVLAADRRPLAAGSRQLQRKCNKLMMLDQHKPADRLIKAQLRVLFLELEHWAKCYVR